MLCSRGVLVTGIIVAAVATLTATAAAIILTNDADDGMAHPSCLDVRVADIRVSKRHLDPF